LRNNFLNQHVFYDTSLMKNIFCRGSFLVTMQLLLLAHYGCSSNANVENLEKDNPIEPLIGIWDTSIEFSGGTVDERYTGISKSYKSLYIFDYAGDPRGTTENCYYIEKVSLISHGSNIAEDVLNRNIYEMIEGARLRISSVPGQSTDIKRTEIFEVALGLTPDAINNCEDKFRM